MANDETVRKMTKALRNLNEALDGIQESSQIQQVQQPINAACQICAFTRKVVEVDIGDIKEMREMLINKMNNIEDADAASSVAMIETYVNETAKRYGVMKQYLDIAHYMVHDLLESRVAMIDPEEHPEMMDFIKNIMSDADIPMPFKPNIDPKKAN